MFLNIYFTHLDPGTRRSGGSQTAQFPRWEHLGVQFDFWIGLPEECLQNILVLGIKKTRHLVGFF